MHEALRSSRAAFFTTFGAAACTLACWPARAKSAGTVPLRIVIIPAEISGGVYFAQDLHYFERAGIAATISTLGTGAAIVAAVAAGATDIGITNPISLALARQKGIPLVALAGAAMHDSKKVTDGLLTVAAKSPIRSAKDLDGKTIACSGLGSIGYVAARNWIDHNGGDSKTAQFIEMPLPQMGENVASGRIDAAVMDAGGISRTGQEKLRTIGSTFDSYARRFVASYWCCTTDWIAKNTPTAKSFVSIMKQASAWGNQHPEDARAIFARHSAYTREQLATAVDPTFATALTPAMLQPVLDVAAAYGIIRPVEAPELISPLAG